MIMTHDSWFEDFPVLGKLPPAQAAAKLRELGDNETAASLETVPDSMSRAFGKLPFWPSQDKPWQHTAHAFGYLAAAAPGNNPLPIRHAGNIVPDTSLKNGRINIRLDRLRIAAYPGGGMHRVLFDFYAQNQVPGNCEHLHFNATYRGREGEQVGVIGYPIFVGLNVGTDGVALKCFTVNVANQEDEAFLGFLDFERLQNRPEVGLHLATRHCAFFRNGGGRNEVDRRAESQRPGAGFLHGT